MKRLALAILLLLTFGATAPAQNAMPPLPSAVPSQLGPVRIFVVPNPECGGEKVLGCFDGVHRFIVIADSMPLPVAWQTLRHEVFHMIVWDAGIHQLLPPNVEDAIADALGSYDVFYFLLTRQAAPAKPTEP